jgi:site-specific recombinase XerD
MALEQAFECPTTLAKLRSGPLGTLLEGFCDWLLEQGFSRWSVRTHLSNLFHLNEHLGSQRRSQPQSVTTEDLDGFFRAYPGRCRHRGPREEHVRRVRWSVNRFVGYLKQQGPFVELAPQPIYAPLRDAYLDWMQCYQHAAPGTLEVRASSLTQFLQWLGPEATPDGLAGLDCDRVEQFFLTVAQGKGRSARRSMQSALRTFFRFCLHQGYVQQQLDRAVPTLRTYKLATVPRGLTDEQSQQVLRHICRDTAVGRRDYAILQLLYTYGVRGGQVRSLCLEEIDWARDQILFRAAKHGKDIRLPLIPEVGESLLDYLRNARPACSCPEVFLTCRAPYHRLPNPNSLSALVERRIRAAGIDVVSSGAHAFRHGFATQMLQQGHSLKAIADVLGHRHLSTTFLYTKVDFNALRQVALPWPEEVSE